jgi:hypothetical protein
MIVGLLIRVAFVGDATQDSVASRTSRLAATCEGVQFSRAPCCISCMFRIIVSLTICNCSLGLN